MYVVKQIFKGNTFYLRGTIFTAHLDRADRFETKEAAQAKFEKAHMFMKKMQIKATAVVETPTE